MTSQQATMQPERTNEQPRTPAGQGVFAGAAGALPWSSVDEWLQASQTYWLTIDHSDGPPHVTPVWGIWQDGVLYFGSDRTAHKAHHLAVNPNIAVRMESNGTV